MPSRIAPPRAKSGALAQSTPASDQSPTASIMNWAAASGGIWILDRPVGAAAESPFAAARMSIADCSSPERGRTPKAMARVTAASAAPMEKTRDLMATPLAVVWAKRRFSTSTTARSGESGPHSTAPSCSTS